MKNSLLRRALTVCAAFSLFTGIAEAKLVAWYPLDESPADAAATTAENISANDATLIGFDPDPELSMIERGHVSAQQGLGSAYLLNKASGFDLGEGAAVQPTDKFTISFWFQPQTLDGFDRLLESQMGNDNSQSGLRIDTGTGGNRARVLVRDGDVSDNTNFSHPTQTVSDGTWYFFAFRYDSAGIDNAPFQITLLEAGGTPDAAAIAAATSGPANINTGPMSFPHVQGTFIGLQDAGAGVGNAFHGGMDEIAFWDNSDGSGVLSDAQLADVFNFGPSGVQLINSFTTDTDSVSPGNPATLSWDVAQPLDALVLEDGVGGTTNLPTTPGTGSTMVTPAITTTYSLRATSDDGENVANLRILAGAAPAIDSFTALPRVIQTGGSVDLSWSVSGADTLTLDPGGIDVSAMTTRNESPTETTNYTLSATNGFGTSTADVIVSVLDGPVPVSRYVASTGGNDEFVWQDEVGGKNWLLGSLLRNDPLGTASPNTNITAAYMVDTEAGGVANGATGSFALAEFAGEIWLRPGTLNEFPQAFFESGGGQNGISALISQDTVRVLGSESGTRNLDITVPLAGMNLTDFIQIVFSKSNSSGNVDVTVRDTFGNTATNSAAANVNIGGGNSAGIFTWRPGGDANLGGRGEVADPIPGELAGFTGEIGIINVYDRILDATELQATFDRVATVVDPPGEAPFTILQVVHDDVANTVTLTWDSIIGNLYDAQFSTDLTEWFNLDVAVSATVDETTQAFNIPPNQEHFFLRIIDLGED